WAPRSAWPPRPASAPRPAWAARRSEWAARPGRRRPGRPRARPDRSDGARYDARARASLPSYYLRGDKASDQSDDRLLYYRRPASLSTKRDRMSVEQQTGRAAEILARSQQYVLHPWATQATWQPTVFSTGEGCYLVDADGNRYLDFSSQ